MRTYLSKRSTGACVRNMYRSMSARGRPSVSLSQSLMLGGGRIWGGVRENRRQEKLEESGKEGRIRRGVKGDDVVDMGSAGCRYFQTQP
jgi:hypothetical protein